MVNEYSMETKGPAIRTDCVLLKPFLRWAGGKQKLTKLLLSFAPPWGTYDKYYEPFFGAGALFFAVQPQKAILSDINAELMNCYGQIAKYPKSIGRHLKGYAQRDSRDFFHEVRAMPIANLSPRERAARFVYLNKAAFNGIYRVNKNGEFNVPTGSAAYLRASCRKWNPQTAKVIDIGKERGRFIRVETRNLQ